jgi:hypothetical protein
MIGFAIQFFIRARGPRMETRLHPLCGAILLRFCALSALLVVVLPVPSLAQDDCLGPIAATKISADGNIPVDRATYKFQPFSRVVCLPTRRGECREVEEKTVAILLELQVNQANVLSTFEGMVRDNLREQRILPKKGELDTSVGGFSVRRVNQDTALGEFALHAETWAIFEHGFCCRGFKCRKCDWKTRVWERTWNVDVSLTQRFFSDYLEYRLEPEIDIDDSSTFLEKVGVTLGLQLLAPGLALAGPIAADKLSSVITRTIEDAIPDIPGVASGDPKKRVAEYFGNTSSIEQVWPRFAKLVESFRYSPSNSGFFQSNNSWVHQLTLWTDPKYGRLIEYHDFCAFVRPLLEGSEGNMSAFVSMPATPVMSVGNHDIKYTLRPNDSLWKVAKEVYGSPSMYRHIAVLNGISLSRADFVPVGSEIFLPSVEKLVEDYYVLRRGDSLWKLARDRLGAGGLYRELIEANRSKVDNPDVIYRGDLFILPK